MADLDRPGQADGPTISISCGRAAHETMVSLSAVQEVVVTELLEQFSDGLDGPRMYESQARLIASKIASRLCSQDDCASPQSGISRLVR